MWQTTTWHASAGAGGKGSSACSTHDFLSRYGDGSSLFSDQSSGRGGVSSLTTQDFLQPLERGNNTRGGTVKDGRVPSSSEKSGRGEPRAAHSPPLRDGPSADRQVPGSNTAFGSSHIVPAFGGRSHAAAMESAANSLSRKLAGSNADAIRSVPFVNSSTPAPAPTPAHAARDEHSVIEHSRGSDTMTDPDSSDFLARERAENLAHWSSVRLKFGMSDLAFAAKNSMSQNSLEPGLNPGAAYLKQWQQPSQGMSDPCRRPVKVPSEDDEDEDDEYMDKTRDMRKDGLFQKGDSAQKLDGKNGGTPRSKHSATEQRRRSKINDRFQMLRQLVPHSDQKRDKASFLLEVIEYIQILKDKVKKYENVEHGRNQDRLKSMVWDLCKRNAGAGDSAVNIDASWLDSLGLPKEQSSPVSGVSMDIKQQPAQMPFGRTLGGYPVPSKPQLSNEGPLANPMSTMSNSTYDRENFSEAAESMSFRGRPNGHLTSAGIGGASSQEHSAQQQQHLREHKYYAQAVRPLQPDVLSSAQSNEDGVKSFASKAEQRQYSPPPAYGASLPRHQSACVQSTGNDTPHSAASRRPQPQLNGTSQEPSLQESSRDPPNSSQEPVAIQGGVINVSSVYSQGLLDTLTKALQSSGLDLSQANISVQIDLCKTTAATSTKVAAQTPESSTQSHQSQEHTRQAGSYPDSDLQHPHKRPKLEIDVS